MRFRRLSILLLLTLGSAAALPLPRERTASADSLTQDLQVILREAGLPPDSVEFEQKLADNGPHRVQVVCDSGSTVRLRISATSAEWGAPFYYGLQKLGFLFPQPRVQISPTRDRMRAACGSSSEWRPRLRYRGFHLHLVHPNEWVLAFLGRNTAIGEDTVRWMARNSQNVLQVNLLRTTSPEAWPGLRRLMEYGHGFGIHFGVAVAFAQFQ